MPHRLHLRRFGAVHALPVLHNRMEFAHLAAEAFRHLRPDCVAVEFPHTLAEPFARGVGRLPRLTLLSYDCPAAGKETVTTHLLIEPADPFAEAVRLAMEQDIPWHPIDLDLDSYPEHDEPLPDPYSVQRIGLGAFYRAYCEATAHLSPAAEDLRREQGMAFRLQQLAAAHGRILFICGMFHLERIAAQFGLDQARPLERTRREGVRLFNLHPECCAEVLAEHPFLSAVYELRRNPLPPEPLREAPSLRRRFNAFELIAGGREELPEAEILRAALERAARRAGAEGAMPDRQRVLYHLFQEAARHYRQETGEALHLWQKRTFFRFVRNYALQTGRLLPDLFQTLTAARACVDDNFAFALFRLAAFYPWQKEQSDLPTLAISAAELYGATRRIRPRKKGGKGFSTLPFLQRKREKRAGEWLEGFDDPSICSYPPEDVTIEAYADHLKKKGTRQLSEERVRVEPLTASLLDGIDLRETIRNHHEGRLYVREQLRVKGGVDCVVLIFDEDRRGERYPYCTTWLGEHAQESDMAFYATAPLENVVGPGICRCEYGGLLLSSPPRRMRDVWSDPDYRGLRFRHEVLLLAALDYSRAPSVVYAAPRPPRALFRQLAGRMGKRIIYLPLGSLSPVTLKRLRVFHVLSGRDKREIAKDYVW
ncbi:MAG: hypothetical protein HYV06_05230 [Deltaproteobacteria bacterium]|nr:hypothetical protein [Deltaproteobacteria bacterium]